MKLKLCSWVFCHFSFSKWHSRCKAPYRVKKTESHNGSQQLNGGNMKLLTTILALTFVGMNAMASGKTPPRSDGNGTPQCRAYDAGSTEEHSPHPSCESCLSAGHGSCDMKCYSYDYTCTAKSRQIVIDEVIDPVTKQPQQVQKEIEVTFSATAPTEWMARDSAMRQCYWSQHSSFGPPCEVSSCSENSHQSSSSSCR